MNQSTLTIEALLQLVPELEELDGLRTSVIRAGVPDPAMEWSRSGALSTVDKRLLPQEGAEQAIAEAERALATAVTDTFRHYREIFRSVTEDRPSEAVAHLIALGEHKERIGLYGSARKYFEVALTHSLPLPEKTDQIRALLRLARVSLRAGDIPEGVQYYQRSAEVARDAGDLQGIVAAGIGLGYPLALQGRWPDAERYHREALAVLEDEIGGPEARLERGQIFNNLGYFAARQGRMDEAREWLGNSLAIWGDVDSPADLGVYHHCMAFVCKSEGEMAGALEHYQSALQLDIPAAFRVGISIDIAESHLISGEISEANSWIHRAEEDAIAARAPYVLGRVYQVRGNIARAVGLDDGFVFYEKALEIARARGLRLLEGETLLDYAMLRTHMGEREEARSYIERAREIFAESDAATEMVKAEELLESLAASPTPPPAD